MNAKVARLDARFSLKYILVLLTLLTSCSYFRARNISPRCRSLLNLTIKIR